MKDKYKHISRVENYISMMLAKAGISDHRKIGGVLPAAPDKTWNDMVFVDLQPLRDYDSHAEGSVNIFLYAKATDSTSNKPVARLEAMETALDTILEKYYSPHYVTRVKYRDQGYDENIQFYYNIVNIEITAK